MGTLISFVDGDNSGFPFCMHCVTSVKVQNGQRNFEVNLHISTYLHLIFLQTLHSNKCVIKLYSNKS